MIYLGDAAECLRHLKRGSVDCCVTSPPYYGLRDYKMEGQIGLEKNPKEYVSRLVDVFREIRRVLRPDGTCWVVIGDSYAANGGHTAAGRTGFLHSLEDQAAARNIGPTQVPNGFKPKDLLGIPWQLALALRDDGWYLRQDIVWSKPNPMPESVRDRCTRSHEYIFLLTKNERYFWNWETVQEPLTRPHEAGRKTPAKFGGAIKHLEAFKQGRLHSGNEHRGTPTGTRNPRDVWTITTQPVKEAHFATFPKELVRRCLLAGCRPGGTVLDPFMGSGTTGIVAQEMGLHFIGCDLNPEYLHIAAKRGLNISSIYSIS